jgi:hypothetical protein
LPTLDRRSTEEQQERNKETAGGKNMLAGGKAQAAERSQETKSLAPAKTTENQKSTGARSAVGSENKGGNTSKRRRLSGIRHQAKLSWGATQTRAGIKGPGLGKKDLRWHALEQEKETRTTEIMQQIKWAIRHYEGAGHRNFRSRQKRTEAKKTGTW